MEKKTVMRYLLEKIERMPDENIKNYLKIIGIFYLEAEKKQMDSIAEDYWNEGARYIMNEPRKYESFEQYYNKKYGTGNI